MDELKRDAAADADRLVHISSALILTRREAMEAVRRRIAALPDAEVAHAQDGRLVVVMEGPDGRRLGDRLAEIALYDGVLAANMVFEQVETEERLRQPVGPQVAAGSEAPDAAGAGAEDECRGERP